MSTKKRGRKLGYRHGAHRIDIYGDHTDTPALCHEMAHALLVTDVGHSPLWMAVNLMLLNHHGRLDYASLVENLWTRYCARPDFSALMAVVEAGLVHRAALAPDGATMRVAASRRWEAG